MAIEAGQDADRICYQSLMYSFGKLLVGTYYDLIDTKITDRTSWTLTDIDWTTRDGAHHGVQQLFQNITLSILNSSSLTMNVTMASRNSVQAEVFSMISIYHYDVGGFWLAYGIATAVSVLGVLVGGYAIWRNGACYQNTLSTFVCTSQDEALVGAIGADGGAEPLPRELAGR